MIEKKSPIEETFHVYVARLSDGELYFGTFMNTEDIVHILNPANPRIQGKLPLTLVSSWSVPNETSARSAMRMLMNAPGDRMLSALGEETSDIHEFLLRVTEKDSLILCSRCGSLRARFDSSGVCEQCYRKEPSTKCVKCGQLKHHVLPDTKLCPKCTEIEARPVQPCSHCRKTKPIIDTTQGLCKECQKYLRLSAKRPKSPPKIVCSVCKKLRSAGRKSGDICRMCASGERAIAGTCAGCGKRKEFKIKSRRLCARCAMDRSAPNMIRKFLKNFQSPFSGSQRAFEILSGTVVLDKTTFSQAQRVIRFGRFLQSYELVSPLNWDSLDQALDLLPPKTKPIKDVRSCLLAVGHLLANAGTIESRSQHLLRRRLSDLIDNAPDEQKAVLRSFAEWSLHRKTTYQHVIAQVQTICALWTWCVAKDVTAIGSINQYCIQEYFRTTYWELRCECDITFPTSTGLESRRCSCGSRRPPVMIPKLGSNSLRGVRGRLIVFFDWACNNFLVKTNPVPNPVQLKVSKPQQRIQHCSVDELAALYKSIEALSCDPAEGLAVYLTLGHLFTVWELQKVQFPRLEGASGELNLAEVYGLTAPRRPVSLGRHSGGREQSDVSFLENARHWLPGLLRRFQEQRSQLLNGAKNNFLFVAPGRGQHNIPASKSYISHLVLRASKRALGYEVSQKLLRKTAALVVVANGPEILKRLGYDEQQAIAYVEAHRELIASTKK